MFDQRFLRLSDEGADFCQHQYDIHLLQRTLCDLHHVFSQLILCLMQAGRILENHLAIIVRVDRHDFVPGRLRFCGSNGNFLADHLIHQGRLAHVRTPNQRNDTGFKFRIIPHLRFPSSPSYASFPCFAASRVCILSPLRRIEYV